MPQTKTTDFLLRRRKTVFKNKDDQKRLRVARIWSIYTFDLTRCAALSGVHTPHRRDTRKWSDDYWTRTRTRTSLSITQHLANCATFDQSRSALAQTREVPAQLTNCVAHIINRACRANSTRVACYYYDFCNTYDQIIQCARDATVLSVLKRVTDQMYETSS